MATNPMNILIVGAGIGGLYTALALAQDGHSVTVLEGVKEFTEVGAGIRVPPNSSLLSLRWGLPLDITRPTTSLGNRFLDHTGRILLSCPFTDVSTRYGAPYYFIHRADLVTALFNTVSELPNVRVEMGQKVAEYDFATPRVRTFDGKWWECDLIVCADGIKSTVRNEINGRDVEPMDTGDVAYRILVPAKPLLEDPEMRYLVENPWAMHWMGPEGHAVGYPLRNGELYNIIIDVTHESDIGEPVGEGEWRSSVQQGELSRRFKDWCPEVRKLCGLTGEYLKWRLADFEQLDNWVHPSGRAVLIGDACHPMMPYMAQGAAQATEDAAVLKTCLREVGEGKRDLKGALKRYQEIRLPRAAYVARNTRVLQEWLHLYDGEERNRRDELMKYDNEDNPMFWGCSERKDWLFGYDAERLPDEGNAVLEVPGLPPLPNAQATVYKENIVAKEWRKSQEARL